ncbi:hypothetical protein TNCV_1241481 [Trichonephila clavipes]|uniref:Uncharacterized protein n=1 Tax=Trichonephila clavipes TaxID=2585209 RepID=A0A8X6WE90_TRICX|nr:hypothetical protein TNCV_1241481 [Trichonephila clavipes]
MLRAQQSNMQPDLRMHICEHIIRVLHQKDVNQKQHICVKHDFVQMEIFVANRIPNSKKTSEASWHHVKSQRGIAAFKLKVHKLWWSGPQWLSQDSLHFEKMSQHSRQLFIGNHS